MCSYELLGPSQAGNSSQQMGTPRTNNAPGLLLHASRPLGPGKKLVQIQVARLSVFFVSNKNKKDWIRVFKFTSCSARARVRSPRKDSPFRWPRIDDDFASEELKIAKPMEQAIESKPISNSQFPSRCPWRCGTCPIRLQNPEFQILYVPNVLVASLLVSTPTTRTILRRGICWY